MNSSTIEKINNLGKIAYIICKVAKIILLVCAILTFAVGIIMSLIPKNAVKLELKTTSTALVYINGSKNFEELIDLEFEDGIIALGNNSYKIVASDEADGLETTNVLYLSNIKWLLFAASLVIAASCVIFYFAEKLFAELKSCTTPFTENISKGILKLAWSLVAACIAGCISTSLTESVFGGLVSISFNIDILTVFLILCVFMLSFVFKYGTSLQTESDETL